MQSQKQWTAALAVIGDEILSGPDRRTRMSRRSRPGSTGRASAWPRCGSCPTTRQRIAEAVNALRARHDYLFTTGGIGPTHDDITVDSIAAALGVPVVVHPEARRILEDYYADRGPR